MTVQNRMLIDRHERGLSQQEMADLIGVSVDVVRNLEATGNRPRFVNARRIADHFGCKVIDLWPLDYEPKAAA